MWRYARPFRLLIVLVAILIVFFIHWLNRSETGYLFRALYYTWAQNTMWHENILSQLVERKLNKPFSNYDSKIEQFVIPKIDSTGFLHWLHQDAIHDTLVGAGFIWNRDMNLLRIIPLSMQIDTATIRRLDSWLDACYKMAYELRSTPRITAVGIDSLKNEINKQIGFTPYSSLYPGPNRYYPIKGNRADADNVTLGIIWNPVYYRRSVLPSIREQIEADPKEVGLLKVDPPLKDFYNGILLTDAKKDTIVCFGQVELEPDTLLKEYGFSRGLYHQPLERMPGWQLYVQDHWQVDPRKEIKQQTGIMEPYFQNRQYALRLVKLASMISRRNLDRGTMLLLSVALGILVLVILIQIIASNRQRDFIAHVSHELRTPVAKVKLFAETLRQDRAVSEEKENEYLDTILRESDHLSVLINNTLNLARLDAGRLKIIKQTINISEWVTKIIEKHRPGLVASGFNLQLDIEPDLPNIKADPESMELALNNLIDNAVKYSAERKEIQISMSKKDKDKVQIAVSDRGIGIPTGKRKAIFKRFYRIKPKDREPIAGAGMGLSLVKEIIKRHRGRVWCQARDGGGSIFIMELPKGAPFTK